MSLICAYDNVLECIVKCTDSVDAITIERDIINNVVLGNGFPNEVMWTNEKNELIIYDLNTQQKATHTLPYKLSCISSSYNNKKFIITDGQRIDICDKVADHKFESIKFYERLPNNLKINQIQFSLFSDVYYFSDCRQNKLYSVKDGNWTKYTINEKFTKFLCNPNQKNSILLCLVKPGYIKMTLNKEQILVNKIFKYPHKFIEYFPFYRDYIVYADTNNSIFIVDSSHDIVFKTIDLNTNGLELTCLSCNESQIACGFSNGLIRIIDVQSNVEKHFEINKSYPISFLSFSSKITAPISGICAENTDDSLGSSLYSNQSSLLQFSAMCDKENHGVERSRKLMHSELNDDSKIKTTTDEILNLDINKDKNNLTAKFLTTGNFKLRSPLSLANSVVYDKSGDAYNTSNRSSLNFTNNLSHFTQPNYRNLMNMSPKSDKADNTVLLQQIIQNQVHLSDQITKLSKRTDDKMEHLRQEVERLKTFVRMENFTTQAVIFEDVVRQLRITESNINRFMHNPN